jgi:hypothetical protein
MVNSFPDRLTTKRHCCSEQRNDEIGIEPGKEAGTNVSSLWSSQSSPGDAFSRAGRATVWVFRPLSAHAEKAGGGPPFVVSCPPARESW